MDTKKILFFCAVLFLVRTNLFSEYKTHPTNGLSGWSISDSDTDLRYHYNKATFKRNFLNGSNLAFSEFTESIFDGAHFYRAYAYQTDFTKSMFINNIDFRYIYARKASFLEVSFFNDVDMSLANFTRADFRKSKFGITRTRPVIAKDSTFKEANFEGASFENAIFEDTSFEGANFKDTNFVKVTFKNCNFKGVKGLTNRQKSFLMNSVGSKNVPWIIEYEEEDNPERPNNMTTNPITKPKTLRNWWQARWIYRFFKTRNKQTNYGESYVPETKDQ